MRDDRARRVLPELLPRLEHEEEVDLAVVGEDEEEVLRRSPTNTYYLEKMRVFEETFGIDKLLKTVDRLQKQISVSILFIHF